LLPLLAIFMERGRLNWRQRIMITPLRLDFWTAWWLFSGLIALSYTFFLDWKTIPVMIQLEFWPLYTLLGIACLRHVRIYVLRFKSETVTAP
jgi:hypothetical protein